MARSSLGRRRQDSFDVRRLLSQHTDALATLAFITFAACLSLILAPSETDADPESALWRDLFTFSEAFTEIEEESPLFTPSTKIIELDLPFEQVPESDVEVPDFASAPPGWHEYEIRRNDTLGGILRKINVDEEARSFLVTQKMVTYRKLRRGTSLYYQLNPSGELVALRYKASPELHFNFSRAADGTMTAVEGAPELTSKTIVNSAIITEDANSLFAASDQANVPDAIIQRMIDALETRIDFSRDTRLGDNFVVVYETLYDEDGEYAGPGPLLGINYQNRGKESLGLLNLEDGRFYTPEGESVAQAFLRSPLKFSRISSRYTLSRYHPVLKKWRSHRGVDFAAPTNTPVRAAADGTISFAGRNGGYGNLVRIEHFSRYSTLYGHLNKFGPKIKKGVKVTQGQLIGYVGSTGLATGPHLHYEFRISDKHVDPLSVDVPTNRPPLEGAELAKFQTQTAAHKDLLERAIGI